MTPRTPIDEQRANWADDREVRQRAHALVWDKHPGNGVALCPRIGATDYEHTPICDAVTALLVSHTAELATRDARLAALQRHYDEAGPEHNLLALLDLYHDRKMVAERERDEALSRAEHDTAAWQKEMAENARLTASLNEAREALAAMTRERDEFREGRAR